MTNKMTVRAACKAVQAGLKAARKAAVQAERIRVQAERKADREAKKAARLLAEENSVILHEGLDFVVIATGLASDSDNTKTGGLVQIYIIHRYVRPVQAAKLGLDSAVCFDCKHRGEIIDGVLVGRRCYVNIGQAPTSIFGAYTRGSYRKADISEYGRLFGGRKVRFGAYGDPVLLPWNIVNAITAVAKKWTGYTHQWTKPEFQAFKSVLMASCDSESEANLAKSLGWRVFQVSPANEATVLRKDDIRCPASKEMSNRSTCDKCMLCDGKKGDGDARKNIVIIDHSAIAKTQPMSAKSLIQISL